MLCRRRRSSTLPARRPAAAMASIITHRRAGCCELAAARLAKESAHRPHDGAQRLNSTPQQPHSFSMSFAATTTSASSGESATAPRSRCAPPFLRSSRVRRAQRSSLLKNASAAGCIFDVATPHVPLPNNTAGMWRLPTQKRSPLVGWLTTTPGSCRLLLCVGRGRRQ